MTMLWTLLIVSVTGTFSFDLNYHSIPMATKDACIRAAEYGVNNSSPQLGFLCVSSETGEVVKVLKLAKPSELKK